MESKTNKIPFYKFVAASIPLFLAVILGAFFIFFANGSKAVDSEENAVVQKVEIPSGTSVKAASKILKEKKLIKSPFVFYAAARFSVLNKIFSDGKGFSLKSGVYRISSSMDISQIYAVLSSGKQEYIHVSFPEGLTTSKIGKKLEENGICSLEDFREAVKNPELLAKFNIPQESLEGYLFPDTYFLTPGMKGSQVAEVMVNNFFEKTKDISGFDELLPEERGRIVILASVVEREYRIKDEAPLIASVFKNRLRYNIGLYSCATVEYMLTEILGREHPDVITYKDLKIDNPYNTYIWAGLPPGAISNPGLVALNAAMHPAKTDYYFFRLVDAEKGRHVFSKDFETHISEGYSAKTKK